MASYEIGLVLSQSRRDLCPREKLLLVVMADGCGPAGEVRVDMESWSRKSSLPKPSLRNTLQSLIRKGFVHHRTCSVVIDRLIAAKGK